MKINAASACWSGLLYEEAVANLASGTVEPILGNLDCSHIQLCPQHKDVLTLGLIQKLQTNYPNIQFRLHSDVRTLKKSGYTIDLSDLDSTNLWYFEELNELSQYINAPLYSLHAGKRSISFEQLIENYYHLSEIFHCPIAIEGHYPFKRDYWLIDKWQEYELFLKHNISYALDLSHLNIVAKRYGWDWDLTQCLISSPNCKEIHISFNDGLLDSHLVATEQYLPMWTHWQRILSSKNSDCFIFSEGNQSLALRKRSISHD